MRSSWRTLAYCVAAGCLFTAASIQADTYTTASAPSSSNITIQFWLGPPGEPGSTNMGSIGALAVTGTVDATVSVDGSGDGTLTFGGSDLLVADSLGNTIGLMFLGHVSVDLEDILIDIASDSIPVTGNSWNLDDDPPTSFDLGLVDGLVTLYDPTGIFSGLDDPTVLDLNTDPFSVGLSDLADRDIGGTASEAEITIDIPPVDIDITEAVLGSGSGQIFIRLFGSIDVIAAP